MVYLLSLSFSLHHRCCLFSHIILVCRGGYKIHQKGNDIDGQKGCFFDNFHYNEFVIVTLMAVVVDRSLRITTTIITIIIGRPQSQRSISNNSDSIRNLCTLHSVNGFFPLVISFSALKTVIKTDCAIFQDFYYPYSVWRTHIYFSI